MKTSIKSKALMGVRAIDKANRIAKKPESIFKGKDYLGTSKGSKIYKNKGFNYGK